MEFHSHRRTVCLLDILKPSHRMNIYDIRLKAISFSILWQIYVLLWLAHNPGICVENRLISREAQASVAMPTFSGTFTVDTSDGCTS